MTRGDSWVTADSLASSTTFRPSCPLRLSPWSVAAMPALSVVSPVQCPSRRRIRVAQVLPPPDRGTVGPKLMRARSRFCLSHLARKGKGIGAAVATCTCLPRRGVRALLVRDMHGPDWSRQNIAASASRRRRLGMTGPGARAACPVRIRRVPSVEFSSISCKQKSP